PGLVQPRRVGDRASLTHQRPEQDRTEEEDSKSKPRRVSWQGLRSWQSNLFDPDWFFTWVQPKLGFFWTRIFVVFSIGCIVHAAVLVGLNREQLAVRFLNSLRDAPRRRGW